MSKGSYITGEPEGPTLVEDTSRISFVEHCILKLMREKLPATCKPEIEILTASNYPRNLKENHD